MKYSIRCNLLPAERKDGTHTIRLRVSWNSQRINHCLATPIRPSDWDGRASMPKRSQQKALKEIGELTAAIDRLFDKCHLEQRSPSQEEVRVVLGDKTKKESGKPNTHNIVAAMDEYIRENTRAGSWSEGTTKRWGVIKSHLKEWNPDAATEDVNVETMQSYMDYLHSLDLHNTTVAKNISWLRSFLRWCLKKGYTTESSWEDYKPRFRGNGDEKDIIYLSKDELRRIMELDLSGSQCLDHVRDVLLFCCFSGLRYSDAAKLRQSDVHGDYISVVTKKTSDSLRIDLNDISSSILKKYQSENKEALALPIISNQKMNGYLKELARMAEITDPVRKVYWTGSIRHEEVVPKWKLITTHCGRRTFVVSALQLEIPAEVIMRWTGHSNHQAMKPYIAIVDKHKKESMNKFNTLMTEI